MTPPQDDGTLFLKCAGTFCCLVRQLFAHSSQTLDLDVSTRQFGQLLSFLILVAVLNMFAMSTQWCGFWSEWRQRACLLMGFDTASKNTAPRGAVDTALSITQSTRRVALPPFTYPEQFVAALAHMLFASVREQPSSKMMMEIGRGVVGKHAVCCRSIERHAVGGRQTGHLASPCAKQVVHKSCVLCFSVHM